MNGTETTATEIRGDVDLESASTTITDVIFSRREPRSGYVYYQNIAAATTSALCTQNTALDSAGAIAGEASPDVPRKLRIVTVDDAGDDLAGTVTLTGLNVEGEQITEVVTIVAGTDTHDTTQAFATFVTGTHDFGATATATDDTLDIGQDTSVALPSKNAVPILVISTGTVETITTKDPDEGTIDFIDAPDGTSDYEVWYRVFGNPKVVTGGNDLRVAITGSTVTGSDVRDIVIHLTKY